MLHRLCPTYAQVGAGAARGGRTPCRAGVHCCVCLLALVSCFTTAGAHAAWELAPGGLGCLGGLAGLDTPTPRASPLAAMTTGHQLPLPPRAHPHLLHLRVPHALTAQRAALLPAGWVPQVGGGGCVREQPGGRQRRACAEAPGAYMCCPWVGPSNHVRGNHAAPAQPAGPRGSLAMRPLTPCALLLAACNLHPPPHPPHPPPHPTPLQATRARPRCWARRASASCASAGSWIT